MLGRKITNFLGLPELEILPKSDQLRNTLRFHCRKTSTMEVCPKCATPSITKYDKRYVTIKDQPIGEIPLILLKKVMSKTIKINF